MLTALASAQDAPGDQGFLLQVIWFFILQMPATVEARPGTSQEPQILSLLFVSGQGPKCLSYTDGVFIHLYFYTDGVYNQYFYTDGIYNQYFYTDGIYNQRCKQNSDARFSFMIRFS